MLNSRIKRSFAILILLSCPGYLLISCGAIQPNSEQGNYSNGGHLATSYDTYVGQHAKVSGEVVQVNPVVIDEGVINQGFARDYDSDYPHSPRGPELSSTYVLAPHPEVSNPVIEPADIDDVSEGTISGTADPYFVPHDGEFHMFFEIENSGSPDPSIGHAPSPDGLTWTYDQQVWSGKDA